HTSTTIIYTLSLHDALPISSSSSSSTPSTPSAARLAHLRSDTVSSIEFNSQYDNTTSSDENSNNNNNNNEARPKFRIASMDSSRSEEHTSELQSRSDIVCRT